MVKLEEDSWAHVEVGTSPCVRANRLSIGKAFNVSQNSGHARDRLPWLRIICKESINQRAKTISLSTGI